MAGANEAAKSLQTASRFPAKVAETLTGARTILTSEVRRFNFFAFDPGGAGRTVTLPPEARCEGVVIFVANTADGAEILTIQDDGTNTIVTPTQAEACVLWCDGVAWYGFVGASS